MTVVGCQPMMLLWGIVIAFLSHCLLVIGLMEFALDRDQKREKDGTLRVKEDSFVIKYIFRSPSSLNKNREIKSLCMLFRGIAFELFIYLVFLVVCSGVIIVAGSAYANFWFVVKFLFYVVAFISCFLVIAFSISKILEKFEGEKFAATRDLLTAWKKKICPPVKMV